MIDPATLQRAWRQAQLRLRHTFGDEAYRQFLGELTMARLDGDTLILAAPHAITAQWLVLNKADTVLVQALQETCPALRRVSCEIARPDTDQQPSLFAANNAYHIADTAHQQVITLDTLLNAEGPAQDNHLFAGTPLDTRFTFDHFVVGKPNEFAFAAARKVADSDSVTANPLFLYGGVGLGKTHLMHAIAWAIKARNPSRSVLYLSAEKFMYRFIRALRSKETMSFKEQFRSVDVLMIDDIQFIAGKESTQEEFFHTFNALIDQRKQIILSSDKSPAELNGIEERLKSRLAWGLVADIHPSTYELRLGVLQAKAEQASLPVPLAVLEFLAHKISTNIRELEGAFNRVVAHAELIGRSVTLDGTQDVLADLLRTYDRVVTLDDIQKKTAAHFGLKPDDLLGQNRARHLARPRQIAMYLAKMLTTKSLPDIGRAFGGRDHTTVLHAVRKIEALMQTDPSLAEHVQLLQRALKMTRF